VASGACSKSARVELRRPFNEWGGFAFAVALPDLAASADSEATPQRSKLVLCEDAKPLGPAHMPTVDIQQKGLGRYVHYGTSLAFSSSDNSNPNRNNRTYSYVLER
jgi:hypothetical protein